MKLHRRGLLGGVAASAIATSVGAAIRLHGGGGGGGGGGGSVPVVTPGAGWNGTAGSGTTQPPALNTAVQGSGWNYSAVGALDESTAGIWIEDPNLQLCVGAAVNDRGGIKQVNVYCESSTPMVITTQTISNKGSQGYVFTPRSSAGQNGEALFTIDIIPFNGLISRITATFILNTDTGTLISRAARYIDYSTGNDANDGLSSATAWKTIFKATNTVPDGGIIYYAGNLSHGGGATYVEDTTTGTARMINRTVDLRPLIAGDTATVTRTAAKQTFNGAANGPGAVNGLRIMCSRIVMEGLTIDLAKFTGFSTGVAIPLLAHKRCAFVDPNGVQGPTYSWNPNEMVEGYAGDCAECTSSAGMGLSAGFIRNSTSIFSWDAMFMFAGFYRMFNYNAYAPLLFHQRASEDTVLTIAAGGVVYNGNNTTTITWTTTATLTTGLSQGVMNLITNARWPSLAVTNSVAGTGGVVRLTVASTASLLTGYSVIVRDVKGNESFLGGNEANDTWVITVVDATHVELQGSVWAHTYVSGGRIYVAFAMAGAQNNGVTSTISDTGGAFAANLSPGDTAWLSVPAHSDALQTVRQSAANDWTMYAQRYRASGKNMQPALISSNHGAVSGSVSTTGTAVTFSTAQTIPKDNYLVTGGNNGRRLAAAISGSTTATLVTAFSPDLSGATGVWSTNSNLNGCFVNCIFDHWGPGPESGQISEGACNIFYIQCTLPFTTFSYRTQDTWNCTEAPGAMDCIFYQLSDGGGGFPNYNNNIDGNFFVTGTLRGTNAGGNGTIGYDSTDGRDGPTGQYTPTSGLTQTVRGINGTGVPLIPFNYYNAVRTSTSLIGAV